MTIKNCYILDNSRGFVFYGPLDESLVVAQKHLKD